MNDNAGNESKKCPYCSEEIPADSTKCPRCLALLIIDATQSAPPREPQTYSVELDEGRGAGFAVASLVLGILGLLGCCCCCSPIASALAIVFGIVAKSMMKRKGEYGSGMATAGIILGIIGILFTIVGIVIGILVSFFGEGHVPWNC
jgi:hypothetical protein